MRRLRDRIARLLPYTPAALPMAAVALLILRYGVTLPTVEQFQYVKTMRSVFLDGDATWSQMFWQQPSSDHIAFFPLLVTLAWARMTHWNVGAELLLSPLLSLAVLAMLMRLGKRLGGYETTWRNAALAFGLSLLLFSARQWETWIWSMNYLFIFIPACCLLSLTLLSRKKAGAGSFWLAAGVCAVATFSFGSGIVTWVAALPLLLAEARDTRRRWKILAWTLAWMACLALYVTSYAVRASTPHLSPLEYGSWVRWGHFASMLWSQMFLADQRFTVTAGRIVIATTALLLFMTRITPRNKEAVLALRGYFGFMIACSLLIAYGRAGLGLELAEESRYTTLMATGLALPLVLSVRIVRPIIVAALLSAISMVWITQFPVYAGKMHSRYGVFAQGIACLQTYAIASDSCLGVLYFQHGSYVRRQAQQLDRLGYLPLFTLPDDFRWDDVSAPHEGNVRLWQENPRAEWLLYGTARPFVCGGDARILLTVGPERQLLGMTVGIPERYVLTTEGAGCSLAKWHLPLPKTRTDGLRPADIQAWIHDERGNRAVRLEWAK